MYKNIDGIGEGFEREQYFPTLDSNHKTGLADIHSSMFSTTHVDQALKKIVEAAQTLSPADDASIILWDAKTESFFMSATTVPNQADWVPIKRVRKTSGATHWITRNQREYVVSDIQNDRIGANGMLLEYGYKAYIGVPILLNNKSLGVIYCLYKSSRAFDPEEIDFMHQLAAYAANSIQSAVFAEQSQKQIHILASLVEERNRSINVVEDKLIDLDGIKSKFVTQITHEFRTPIANAYLYLDLLTMTGPEKREKYMKRIKTALVKLENLIEDAIHTSTDSINRDTESD